MASKVVELQILKSNLFHSVITDWIKRILKEKMFKFNTSQFKVVMISIWLLVCVTLSK